MATMSTGSSLPARNRSRSPSPPSSNESPPSSSSHSSPESTDFLQSQVEAITNLSTTPWISPAHPSTFPAHKSDVIWDPSVYGSQTQDPTRMMDESDVFSEFIVPDVYDLNPSATTTVVGSPPPTTIEPKATMHIQPQQPLMQAMYPNQSYAPTPQFSFSPSAFTNSPPVTAYPTTQATNNNDLVHPKREPISTSMQIQINNLPERGAKSRVETQIKMDLELVQPTPSSSSSPPTFQRVNSWRWIRLPKGATTKRRAKKDAKQDAQPHDTLYLSTEVYCTPPSSARVHACGPCVSREAKRIERKQRTRIRPPRDSSEEEDEVPPVVRDRIKEEEEGVDDASRIVLFNCPELVEFGSGLASLPVRITCYCRHHREKVGFRVHFILRDASGRIVARGQSPPVMITDDHKATLKSSGEAQDVEDDDPTGLAKRKRRVRSEDLEMDDEGEDARARKMKKRPAGQAKIKSGRSSRLGSPGPGPATLHQVPPLVSRDSMQMTPNFDFSGVNANHNHNPNPTDLDAVLASLEVLAPQNVSESALAAVEALNQSPSHTVDLNNSPFVMGRMPYGTLSSPSGTNPSTAPGSPSMDLLAASSSLMYTNLFATAPPPPPSPPSPVIHRLIPNSGPTHGGVEVTILGANFTVDLQAIFGETVASSTVMWSENAMVCVLPPCPTPGPVMVWFKDLPNPDGLGMGMEMMMGGGVGQGEMQVFTYTDNADRALMELALQVVGFSMTGRSEDPRNVAMRIVNQGSSGASSFGGAGQGRTVSDLNLARIRSAGGSRDLQSLIVDFLKLLDIPLSETEAPGALIPPDAISLPNAMGQTLLHFATMLGFHRLVTALVELGADVDARDRNGFTALHFAAMCGRLACARVLLRAQADLSVVEARGMAAKEVARMYDQVDLFELLEEAELEAEEVSEEETPPLSPGISADDEASVKDVKLTVTSPGSNESLTPRGGQRSRAHSAVPSRVGSHANLASLRPTPPPGNESDLYSTEDEQPAQLVRPLRAPDEDRPPSFMDASAAWLRGTRIPELTWGLPTIQMPDIALAWPTFEKGRGGYYGMRTWYGTRSEKAPPAPPQMFPLSEDEVPEAVPLEEPVEEEPPAVASTTKMAIRARIQRRLGFDPGHVTEREVDAYEYYSQKMRRLKQDRMLMLFWLPILLIVVAWGVYETLPIVAGVFKNSVHYLVPFRDPLRV